MSNWQKKPPNLLIALPITATLIKSNFTQHSLHNFIQLSDDDIET